MFDIKNAEGVVKAVVREGKEWQVYVRGIYWFARSIKPADLAPGASIRVVGQDSIKLLIEPA